MAFTIEEEKILKLIVAEMKSKIKLNAVNLTMGNEIRSEFNVIDTSIRKTYEPIYLPLEADVQTAQDLLKAEAEK